MIEKSTRRGNDHVRALADAALFALALLSAADDGGHDPEEGEEQLLDGLLDLDAQLARGHEDKRVGTVGALDLGRDALKALDDRDEVGQRFAGTRFRFDHHVASFADQRDGGGLDDRGVCEMEYVGTLQHFHLAVREMRESDQLRGDVQRLEGGGGEHGFAGHQAERICETRVLHAFVGSSLCRVFARTYE